MIASLKKNKENYQLQKGFLIDAHLQRAITGTEPMDTKHSLSIRILQNYYSQEQGETFGKC